MFYHIERYFLKDLKLIYFKMRALAETPQLLLHYAEIPYSYLMSWEFYKKPWGEVKSNVPFHQLPILVVDNKTHIAQSGSIVRYIAKFLTLFQKIVNLPQRLMLSLKQPRKCFLHLIQLLTFLLVLIFNKNARQSSSLFLHGF